MSRSLLYSKGMADIFSRFMLHVMTLTNIIFLMRCGDDGHMPAVHVHVTLSDSIGVAVGRI